MKGRRPRVCEAKPRPLSPDLMAIIKHRLNLEPVPDSLWIYVGDCPFCGGKRKLHVWQNRALAKCSYCGLDAWFGPAPEKEDKWTASPS